MLETSRVEKEGEYLREWRGKVRVGFVLVYIGFDRLSRALGKRQI
jgi:hypothetical protein